MPTASTPPVRGTQSFVGVMSHVWNRPLLTALEIAWRWVPVIGVLAICSKLIGIAVMVTPSPRLDADLNAFSSLSVFQPATAISTIATLFRDALADLWPLILWLAPLIILLWNLIAALGRTLVLRRLDPTLHPRRLTVFLLGTLRTLCLISAWALWLSLVVIASRIAITTPAAHNEEPSLVLFAAMLIGGTLALYCLWAVVSWPLQLAPLLAMRKNLGPLAALHAAITSAKDLRSKLIEINLVMNIVKLALIVLAMVFSASPLPFSSVATTEFLHLWWLGVILLYLAMSDYFHVVRAAAYLTLHRAYNSSAAA